MAYTDTSIQIPLPPSSGPLIRVLQYNISGNTVDVHPFVLQDANTPTNLSKITANSELVITGNGTAGVAALGVVTIQGIASGVAVPVSGSFSISTGTQVSASNETGTIYNGSTALTPTFAKIVASNSGVTNVIAAVGGKSIRVTNIVLVANGAVNVKFQSHVIPTDLTGLLYLGANGGFASGYDPTGHFQTISGEALDINLSGAVAVGGWIKYILV